MTTRICILTVLSAATAFLGGCHSSSQPPAFTISNARIVERSPQATLIKFDVNGDNPNRDPVRLTDIEYAVTIAGAPAFQGTRAAGTTLRSFGQGSILIPVPAPTTVAAGATYNVRATIGYVPNGTFSQTIYDAGITRPSVVVEQSGVLADSR